MQLTSELTSAKAGPGGGPWPLSASSPGMSTEALSLLEFTLPQDGAASGTQRVATASTHP